MLITKLFTGSFVSNLGYLILPATMQFTQFIQQQKKYLK